MDARLPESSRGAPKVSASRSSKRPSARPRLPRSTATAESRPSRSENPVTRNGQRHQGPHAVVRGAARSLGLWVAPKDFDDLIRILDNEIGLITPTDPEGKDAISDSVFQTQPGQKYYQLTHDYLVHSIGEWLTRKQKETRRGRAELLLADRAAVWNSRPENRQLPSLVQWCTIRWWTPKRNWTPQQKMMMAKAARYHAMRSFVLAMALALVGWGAYEGKGALKAHALRDRLLDANTNEVPIIVQDMDSSRRWINRLLHEAYVMAEADKDAGKQLHASLALLPVDGSQVAYLYDRLLDAEPNEVPVIRDALAAHKHDLLEKLWAVVEKPQEGKQPQRLRAAAALAKYDPGSEKWAKCSPLVVNDLVLENPVYLGQWSEAFRPVKNSFLAPLGDIFRDRNAERASNAHWQPTCWPTTPPTSRRFWPTFSWTPMRSSSP